MGHCIRARLLVDSSLGPIECVASLHYRVLYVSQMTHVDIPQPIPIRYTLLCVGYSLLATCKSPFLVDLKHAFQDEENLYLLMTFMGGGDLDWFVRTHGAVQEKNMAFYAAEILLGLEAIHRQNYIYRDLKPKNILLDHQGTFIQRCEGLHAVSRSCCVRVRTYVHSTCKLVFKNTHFCICFQIHELI